ncbi:MAG: PPOX class F420-dependent oxidoreductase [Anaerolineales bacterium]
MAFEHLRKNNYISVTTFRKNGAPVPTPVWFAHDADRLVVLTLADSGKAKRLRHTSRVEIAPCDVRGNPKGAYVPAECYIIGDEADGQQADRALNKKYGLQKRLFQFFSNLGGKKDTIFLEIYEPKST